MSFLGDLQSITTYDGKVLTFNSEVVQILAYGNYGAPPTQFQTRRGYKQIGETVVDYTLGVRSITLEMRFAPECTRAQYWQLRQDVLDWFRPNRGGAFMLTVRFPDGQKRAIYGRANPGFVFPAIDENSWQIRETIEVLCHDPIWFDPDATTCTPTIELDTNLVFPITFPIQFGNEGGLFDCDITYAGTWVTYPTITILGGYSRVLIMNMATGVSIQLTVPIGLGEQRIITLEQGNQSIVDADGNTKFGELSPDSNLVEFNIRPDPLVAGGVQTIRTTLFGGIALADYTYPLIIKKQLITSIFSPTLIRYYQCNSIAGSGLIDSAAGQDGSLTGTNGLNNNVGVQYTGNQSIELDRSLSQYATIPVLDLVNASYSVEAIVNPQTFGDGYNHTIWAHKGISGDYVWLFIDDSGTVYCLNGVSDDVSSSGITYGEYNYVTITYDVTTTTMSLYLNGVLVSTNIVFDAFTDPTADDYIGAFNTSTPDFMFTGLLDEISFYSGVLSADQVMDHYLAAVQVPQTYSVYSPNEVSVSYNTRYFGI